MAPARRCVRFYIGTTASEGCSHCAGQLRTLRSCSRVRSIARMIVDHRRARHSRPCTPTIIDSPGIDSQFLIAKATNCTRWTMWRIDTGGDDHAAAQLFVQRWPHEFSSMRFMGSPLDSAARMGELCGLTWANHDLDGPKMRIVQQILKPGPEPIFGPTKMGHPSRVSIAAETVTPLRAHRKRQWELMMANLRPTTITGSCLPRNGLRCGRGKINLCNRCR
jgi:hypothetical protein